MAPSVKRREAALRKWANPAYREHMSKVHQGNKQTPETRAKMAASRRGFKHSPETRAKISRRLKGKPRPWMVERNQDPAFRLKVSAGLRGRVYSKETREKISRARQHQKIKHSKATREKMRQAALGRSVSPETREKMRQSRLRQRFPTKMTSIERSLYDQFKKRRLKFEMHRSMFGRWQPDFVFEGVKLIVQADGDYWHRVRKGAAEKDARFNAAAHKAGWTVWRFAESEIKQHPEACGRAVARFVRSH